MRWKWIVGAFNWITIISQTDRYLYLTGKKYRQCRRYCSLCGEVTRQPMCTYQT